MSQNAFDQIIDNLYVGNIESAEKYGNQFDLVVNCTKDIPFPSDCKKCIRIHVNDTPMESDSMYYQIQTTNVFSEIYNTLQENGKVLIHCFAGVQRSCALTACFLIWIFRMTPTDTIQMIRNKRPIAFFGNVNFMHTINNVYEHRELIQYH
jgi:predicted protein tyrosine phosphatase